MKTMNRTILQYAVIALMTVWPAIASAVEYKNMYGSEQYALRMQNVTVPETSFQSTSSLPGSGSALSSTPMLNADGTATYEGESSPGTPIGPRRIAPAEIGDEDPTPLGDVLFPLLLMVMAYAVSILLRRRKSRVYP